MIRVVLDANVIVSALINPNGVPGHILHHWRESHFQSCVSDPILAELENVLNRKKYNKGQGFSPDDIRELLDALRESSRYVRSIEVLRVVIEDEADDAILATAVACNAHYIVSGDRHLLKLRAHQGIAILSPGEFLRLMDA